MNKHEPVKQLNLKDNETYELAVKFAHKRGASLNGAVKAALKEALDREERQLSKEERLEQIMALSRESAAKMGPRLVSDDDAIGYDEFGLPA